MASTEPIQELRELTAALRAYVEQVSASGGWGMPAASEELKAQRRALVSADAVDDAEPFAEPSPGPPSNVAPVPLASAPVMSAPVLKAPVMSAPEPVREVAPRALAAPVDLAERDERLKVLAQTVAGCRQCGLHATRRQTVFARGSGSSGLCFVGEGPGADEDAQGFPFVGAAGQLLDRMIVAMGLQRDEVYVCNIVKCRPPENRKPTPDEMSSCMPYLHEQLELMAPQVIVALGATAVSGLLGTSDGIMRLRGKWRLYRGRVAVMPTFHPAYLLRTPAAKREVWQDLQAVLQHLGRNVPKPTKA